MNHGINNQLFFLIWQLISECTTSIRILQWLYCETQIVVFSELMEFKVNWTSRAVPEPPVGPSSRIHAMHPSTQTNKPVEAVV